MMGGPQTIFVFGSNLAGIHGAGAAKHAFDHWGAELRNGDGLQGQSYAIPTKDQRIHTMSVKEIEHYVRKFIVFAAHHPEMSFLVTAIGCGLAGHDPRDIAPLFHGAPENVFLSEKLVAALR